MITPDSEIDARIPFNAEISREGSAIFNAPGIPTP